MVPGPLEFKAVVAAAIAAAQSAYYLAQAEYFLARATDAVALKSRAAAIADTYANQGARSGSILPFTSALAGLCAAATAAVVEILPVATGAAVLLQIPAIAVFPGERAKRASLDEDEHASQRAKRAASEASSLAASEASSLAKRASATIVGVLARFARKP